MKPRPKPWESFVSEDCKNVVSPSKSDLTKVKLIRKILVGRNRG